MTRGTMPTFAKTHILIVGDSADLPAVQDKVMDPRYVIHIAKTPRQAMMLLRQGQVEFQLVLVDLAPHACMVDEDEDCIESLVVKKTVLLPLLRQEYPSTQIMFMWAHSRQKLTECGFGHLAQTFQFLHKAGSRRALLAAIDNALRMPCLTYEPIRGWETLSYTPGSSWGLESAHRNGAAHAGRQPLPAKDMRVNHPISMISSRITLLFCQLFHGLW